MTIAIDYTDYWRAAIARHQELIAAGCLSPVGAIRVAGLGAAKDDNTDEQQQSEQEETQ